MSAEAITAVAVQGATLPNDSGGVVTEQLTLTPAARGPWDAAMAHGGAPAALLTRAVERRAASDDQRVSSLAFTFLGPVPLGSVTVRTSVRKPGRRLQIVHGELLAGDRVVMEVRAVLLRRAAIALPSGVGMPWPELPPPEGLAASTESIRADGIDPRTDASFHPTAIEIRPVEGSLRSVTAQAAAWLRLALPLVENEAPSGAQRAAAAADFGNGLAHPVSFEDYLFVNCDLTVSFHRDPAGQWIGLRPRTEIDGQGTGLTTTELHDAAGRFGTATQTLFVDERRS
ncbi:MAG: thioesterase family protein [Patulibacter sp.]|nr:thioesterase family protein [Patulibacter sp.]